MKNFTAILMGLSIALLAGAVGTLAYLDGHSSAVGGSPLAQGQAFYLTPGTGTLQDAGSINATTTKVYLTVGANASSTITGYLDRGNRIDLNIRAVASSSTAVLRYTLDVSPNGVDYYPYQDVALSATSSPPYPYTVGDVKYLWNLSTSTEALCGTNEICKHTVIPNVVSKYFRIRFDVTTAAAAVWAEARVAEPVPN